MIAPEELHEAKEAFTLFDRDTSGKILTCEIGTVLRSLGYSPSMGLLAEFEKEVNDEFCRVAQFMKFAEKASAQSKQTSIALNENLPKLRDGIFYFFEKRKMTSENEKISVKFLEKILTSVGEDKLCSDEIREILGELKVQDGKVSFPDFLDLLMPKRSNSSNHLGN